ncbi:DUF6339 family protein [Streptomyces lydicus]
MYVATGGDRVDDTQLKDLRDRVLVLATEFGFPDKAGRTGNAEFDVRLAELLHSRMGVVPAEAASRDLWAFLGLVLMPDVAWWRYPNPPGDRMLGTDLTRHVFGRMWWRAQLVHSPDDPEPYAALRILGEGAFDQIYARRAALGGSPHMVKSILRVWNELDLSGLNRTDILKDFLKRLLRLAPFAFFDAVDENALDVELRAVAKESLTVAMHARHAREADTVIAPAALQERVGSVFSVTSSRSPSTHLRGLGVPTARTPSEVGTDRPSATGPTASSAMRSVEICAGSGAQALGLERAGFSPALLIDRQAYACATIELNRPDWHVDCRDLRMLDLTEFPEARGVDLLSGGLPRIKAAAAASRSDDAEEREVLQSAVRLVSVLRPKAVLYENLPELVGGTEFVRERLGIETELAQAGYHVHWRILDAADFGVPQHRRSGFLLAMTEPYFSAFRWPEPQGFQPPTVGTVLGTSMAARGWQGATAWSARADRPAPALVGGSERRGGADLGPTGSKRAWAGLGVDGSSLADEVPAADFPADGHPKLTVGQAAMIQAIPNDWQFAGGKTARYRQIGHAMPPPLAQALGTAIAAALNR